ncbi:MAG: nucleotidyltransferase family protein [Clostridiales bacterium]|nr:nucleotidyltransferase family protein [Clostridiales bacterium]
MLFNADNRLMNMLCLIKASLWGTSCEEVTHEVYEEMQLHAVSAIPAGILPILKMSLDLQATWKKDIIQKVAYFANYSYTEKRLPISVPYVILKGTSAAQYYPYPEYRTMGDIDIMTSHDDYELACESLLGNGFKENTSEAEDEFGRHRGFSKNGIEIEVHSFFALLNDPQKAQYLDDLIIKHISPSHVLPDLVNGLTLLEHINQHMEGGLGLRQIIDWMMFVNKCLPDENWPEFCEMARNVGLEKLAIFTTRMCEMYLGLPKRRWSKDADETSCSALMDYVLSCGNFGRKRAKENEPGVSILTSVRTPAAFFRLLHEQGQVNWEAANKSPILKRLAGVYQLGRYLKKGLRRENAITKLKTEIKAAKARNRLFDELGVKRTSKGLAVYENGKYVKTYKRP